MFGRCKHVWIDVAADYHKPASPATYAERERIRWAEGFTIVTLRCVKCGNLNQRELRGEYELDVNATSQAIDAIRNLYKDYT